MTSSITSDIQLSRNVNVMTENMVYPKGSVWLITVNTNVAHQAGDIERTRQIANNISEATDIIFNRDRPDSHFNEVWSTLKDLGQATYKIRDTKEIGNIYGRIHSHIKITWTHYGRVRMNYKRVIKLYKEYMCPSDGSRDCLGVKNVYVNIKAFSHNVEGYLDKGVPMATTPIEGERRPFTRLNYIPNVESEGHRRADREDLSEMVGLLRLTSSRGKK